jgi:preprotein translocase subunit SecG
MLIPLQPLFVCRQMLPVTKRENRTGFDMSTLIIIIHIVVAVALILIVLLQTGKGADMGAAFGGGVSQTLFGGGGASTFLSRLTTIAAIIFMLTSLGLAYLSTHRAARSVMPEVTAPAPEQTEQAPLETPAQPVAEETDEAKSPVQPVAKEADVAKKAPQQAREKTPAKKSD